MITKRIQWFYQQDYHPKKDVKSHQDVSMEYREQGMSACKWFRKNLKANEKNEEASKKK